MSFPLLCRTCRTYHDETEDCSPVNRLAPLKPQPVSRESLWGWVAFFLFLGMGLVFYLGSCA